MATKLLASALRQTLNKTPASSSLHRRLSTAAALTTAPPSQNDEAMTIKGLKISARPLYLDMQATSPVDPRVLDAMLPYYLARYGNPHSRTHLYGWESDQAVETARSQIADLIGASPKEIVFTSGATESNNISVKGVMKFYKEKKRHVVTTQTEHKCVLDSCRHLQQEGFEVTYLPVGTDGIVDLEKLRGSIGVYSVLDMQQLSTRSSDIRDNHHDQCALTVLAEVISVYDDGERSKPEVLVAAGTLALGREPCQSYAGWGVVAFDQGARFPERQHRLVVERISQEHSILSWEHSTLSLPETAPEIPLSVGDTVHIVPNHACVTGAMYEQYFVVDSSSTSSSRRIIGVWKRARGW